MKKRIIGLLLCICICATCFVGCSLYQKDETKTAEAAAVIVGGEVITREEVQNLYTTYYNYGYSYIYTEQELLEYVTNILVNQKLKLLAAKDTVTITEEDFDEIIDSIKSAINDAIDEREKAIIEKAGEELPDRLVDDDETTSTPFDEYESVVVTPYVVGEQISDDAKAQKVAELIANIKAECAQYETRKKAFNEYVAELVQVNAVKNKKSTAESAFADKVDELVKGYEEQKYIDNLQEYINTRIEVTDEAVLKKYATLINEEQQKYAADGFVKTYESATNTTFLLLNYEGAENGYFHVQHLLVKFSDEDTLTLKELAGYGIGLKEYRYLKGLEWLAEDGHTKDNAPEICWFPEESDDITGYHTLEEWQTYVASRASLVDNLTTTYLDPETGKTVKDEEGNEQEKTLAEILALVEEVVNNGSLSNAQKAQEFRKLRYIYGVDPGMTSREQYGYIFTQDFAKLEDSSLTAKGFVGEFVEDTYKLYEANVNGVSIAVTATITDNGAHIIMTYDATTPGTVCEANINAMKETLLSSAYGQSVYEYVYGKILTEKQSTAYNDYIDSIRDNYAIDYKLTKYSEMFK